MAYHESKLRVLWENAGAALGIAGLLLLRPLLRGWYTRWGATESEIKLTLAGDELVPEPAHVATRAITIHAPADEVWRWLVQLGQGRGGLYSYHLLENLAGCKMHNANDIIPELQHLALGDAVRLGPPGYPLYLVSAVQPQRSLVLLAADPKTEVAAQPVTPLPEQYTYGTWAYVLAPVDAGSTRLIVRSRLSYCPATFANWLMWQGITEPMHFVMERKLLKGIKARAEWRIRQTPAVAAV